ncbi:unnamed protein product [Durusdinium trenchii]|uniref:PPPDE domain-containing protein n=2 Tax=Durusdinium trenchii TaxID=1381693 RepID=A0ABP0M8S0_9DINO
MPAPNMQRILPAGRGFAAVHVVEWNTVYQIRAHIRHKAGDQKVEGGPSATAEELTKCWLATLKAQHSEEAIAERDEEFVRIRVKQTMREVDPQGLGRVGIDTWCNHMLLTRSSPAAMRAMLHVNRLLEAAIQQCPSILVALQHSFEAAERQIRRPKPSKTWEEDPEGIPFEGFDRESPLPSPRTFPSPIVQTAPEVTPEVVVMDSPGFRRSHDHDAFPIEEILMIYTRKLWHLRPKYTGPSKRRTDFSYTSPESFVKETLKAMEMDSSTLVSFADFLALFLGRQEWPVHLHLYDLSRGLASMLGPVLLSKELEGVWHTGIVVYGKEYYFGGDIFYDTPANTGFGTPRVVIPLGTTLRQRDELHAFIVDELKPVFNREAYDAARNNCNHFTDRVSLHLACCLSSLRAGVPGGHARTTVPVTHGAAMRFRVCGLTLNELFAYRVPLQAVVKDCRLGMLNYALMIGIFVYATWSPMEQFWGLLSYPEQVMGFQIIYQCRYLVKPDIELSMRTTLRAPHQATPFEELPYCCIQTSVSSTCGPEQLACRRYKGQSVLHSSEEALTVVTRRRIRSEVMDQDEFVADLESFTLLLEPTVFSIAKEPVHETQVMPGNAMRGHLEVGSMGEANDLQHELCRERSLQGEALDTPSNLAGRVTDHAPCYIKADLMHNGNEIFKISTLLRAMGLSLETHRAAHNETIRHRGLVVMLLMDIHSYEYGHGLLKEPFFVLKPIPANRSEFGKERVLPGNTGADTEIIIDDYGLHFLVQPGGTLAHFSFNQFLEEVTTSLALLAASGIVVKFLAVYLFPLGGVYDEAMTKTSPDIHRVEKLMQMSQEELQQQHQSIFPHRRCDTSEKLVLRLSHIQATSSDSESN